MHHFIFSIISVIVFNSIAFALEPCTANNFDAFLADYKASCVGGDDGDDCHVVKCYEMDIVPPGIAELTKSSSLELNGDFKIVPEEIGQLTTLKQLLIFSNELTKLPSTMNNLQELHFFEFTGHKMKAFPNIHFANLRVLRITGNAIVKLPEDIFSTTLIDVQLNIPSYKRKFPSSISKLELLYSFAMKFGGNTLPNLGFSTGMTTIDIASPNLKTVPASYGDLKAYTVVLNGKLTNFVPGFENIQNVAMLSILGMTSKTLPENLYKMPYLTFLSIADSGFEAFPDDLTTSPISSLAINNCKVESIVPLISAPNLKYVRGTYGRVREVPRTLLHKLIILELRNQMIVTLPTLFANSDTLHTLDLTGNPMNNVDWSSLNVLTGMRELNIGRTGTTMIPNLSSLISLQIIDFTKNSIKTLKGISNLPSLALRFTQNEINAFDDTLPSQLKGLYLQENKIIEFPSSAIGDSCGLTEIYLDSNLLKTVGSKVFTDCPLKRFHAPNNKLTYINFDASQVQSLSELNLENNRFEVYPKVGKVGFLNLRGNQLKFFENLAGLTSLTTLYLDRNTITSALEPHYFPPHLANLSVSNNKISKIHAKFMEALPELLQLEISDNEFDSNLPDELFSASNSLRVLGVSGNGFTSLPSSLSNLNIVSLDISRNKLETLPAANILSSVSKFNVSSNPIQDLSPLENMQLDMLDISDIPWDQVVLPSFSKLHSISIIARNVGMTSKTFPEHISSVATSIDFSDNPIRKLPKTFIENNLHVTTLGLRNIGIRKLCDDIFRNIPIEPNFISVDFSWNKLRKIPNTFSNLSSDTLLEIDLSNNKFREVPRVLSDIKVATLNLSGNRIKKFPEDFLETLQSQKVKTLFIRQSLKANYPCEWATHLNYFESIDITVEDLSC